MGRHPLLRSSSLAALLAASALVGGCGAGGSAHRAAVPSSAATSSIRPGFVAPATTQPVGLGPAVTAAQLTACDDDFKAIRAAERSYQLLNGSWTTIADLVATQFLRTASAYYVGIRIGTPAGGYTLLATPTGPCASLPVGAAG
jgi:hypothetical protein